MINSSFNQINSKLLPLFVSKRSITSCEQHYEPKDLNWQWTPRKHPCIICPNFCKSKKCPPKSYFPKWKKRKIPKEILSCPEKPKKMSLKEYFSYLLPDSMQAEIKRKNYKPPQCCRALSAQRQVNCVDQYSTRCCCSRECPPHEWYDQGVVHTLIGGGTYPEEQWNAGDVQRDIDPTPPPSYLIPKCLTAKKGIYRVPSKKCDELSKSLPFENECMGPTPQPKVKPYKFKRKKKIISLVPNINERAIRLSCKHYQDFKTVECPAQLFTRYKSVAGMPPLPVGPACPSVPHRPASESPHESVCSTTEDCFQDQSPKINKENCSSDGKNSTGSDKN